LLFAALVGCVSAAAFFVSAARLRELERLLPKSPSALRGALLARDEAAVRRAVQELFVAEAFEHEALARALLGGSSKEEAVATLNEHLGDVARELSVGRTVPRAMGRVALAAGTLAGVLQVGSTVSSRAGVLWAPALWAFVAGCIGAGAAFELDRRCRDLSERVKAAWDEVAAVCERSLEAAGRAAPP